MGSFVCGFFKLEGSDLFEKNIISEIFRGFFVKLNLAEFHFSEFILSQTRRFTVQFWIAPSSSPSSIIPPCLSFFLPPSHTFQSSATYLLIMRLKPFVSPRRCSISIVLLISFFNNGLFIRTLLFSCFNLPILQIAISVVIYCFQATCRIQKELMKKENRIWVVNLKMF